MLLIYSTFCYVFRKLLLYPKGQVDKKFLALSLEIVDWVFGTPAQRLYVEYKLRLWGKTVRDHIVSEGEPFCIGECYYQS